MIRLPTAAHCWTASAQEEEVSRQGATHWPGLRTKCMFKGVVHDAIERVKSAEAKPILQREVLDTGCRCTSPDHCIAGC